MLELRGRLVAPGKALMARMLLVCEQNMLRPPDDREVTRYPDAMWYENLWDAFDLRSLDSFSATPLTVVTFNYDRSLEYHLVRALRVRFEASDKECAEALDSIGPIHLHGQLGFLPGFSEDAGKVVGFGGLPGGITAVDCIRAAQAIKILHEANPSDDAFARAQSAIAAAERVIFLGFGYARKNVERLRLDACMRLTTKLYLCVTGYTEQQLRTHILPALNRWPTAGAGTKNEDIVQFFHRFPEALL